MGKTVKMTIDIKNPFEGKRIYCVVADTVQHPIDASTYGTGTTYRRAEESRNIEQPAGRIVAQAAHAVSKARFGMLKDEIVRAHQTAQKTKSKQVWYLGNEIRFWPITTIILSARDSFELLHVQGLLTTAGIKWYSFYDENAEAYGAGSVQTAFATAPVEPGKTVGVLDYLPLWKPR